MVGAAFTALTGLGSSLVQNDTNVQLAREQREYDRRMWAEQNKYNSPIEQVKRLRDAGLNPGLAMQNGMLSSGMSSQSAGGQTAPVTDFSPIAQGVRDSVDLYQQKRLQDANINKLNEETYNQSIRNRFENQRQIIELEKLLSDKNLNDASREYYNQEKNRLIEENKWIDQRNSSMIHKNMMEAFQAQEQARYQRTMRNYQEIINEFAPKQQKQILSNLQATYSQIMSAVFANNAAAANSLADKALKQAQEKGVKIDNETSKRIQNSVVKKAFEEAEMVRDSNEREWLRSIHESNGKGGEFLPSPGHVYGSETGYKNFVHKRKFRN